MRLTNYLMLVLAPLALALVGCSNEQGYAQPNQEETTTKCLTFAIATPNGEPLTLKGAIHDKPEWEVKSLTMYQFDAAGTKLMAIDEIDMTKLTQTADAEYTYTKEFTNEEVGVYRFLFVANDKVADVSTGISLADFEKKLMTQKLKSDGTSSSKDLLTTIDGATYIPMTGVAKHGNDHKIAISGTTEPVKVELTRVVARVDVANHIPNLVITKIALRNSSDCTTVFPAVDADEQVTYEAPTSAKRVAQAAGFTAVPTNGLAGIANEEGAQLQKALYLYEGTQPANEAEATAIVVTGKLGGTRDVEYIIPFKRSEVGYNPITVKRNYLYTLRLGDNTPITKDTKVKFTIEDTPWNAVTLNHELHFLRIKYNSLNVDVTRYYPEEQTLRTSNKYTWYKFTLSTLFKGHSEFKFEVISNPVTEEGLKAKLEGDEITLMPESSKITEAFTATYKIWSNANPNHKVILTFSYDPTYKNTGIAH